MPATLAHSAAALPFFYLARRHLPLSALVVGSLTPDFQYLISWDMDGRLSQMLPRVVGAVLHALNAASGRFSHTLAGMAFCLPAGLAALWIFHAVLKRPLLEVVPDWHRRRLLPHAGRFSWWPASQLLLVVLAVALGALSHIALDSFTHASGWVVQHLPALQKAPFWLGGRPVTYYSLLQYATTAAGVAALAICYWLWVRRAPEAPEAQASVLSPRMRRLIRAGLMLGPLALGLAAGLIAMGEHRGFVGFKLLVGSLGMGAHAGLYAFAVAYGAGFTLWRWRSSAGKIRIPAANGEPRP